jgi:hypothetical protein
MPNTFELIASSTVGAGGVASIDFTSIPSTYTDLCLKVSVRINNTSTAFSTIEFNGSASSFSSRWLDGSGSAVSSGTTPSNTAFASNWSGATSNTFNNAEIYIPNYAGSNNKSYSSDSVTENNATQAFADLIAGLWSNTAAINQVTVKPPSGTSFVQYSTAYLYGVKNA